VQDAGILCFFVVFVVPSKNIEKHNENDTFGIAQNALGSPFHARLAHFIRFLASLLSYCSFFDTILGSFWSSK